VQGCGVLLGPGTFATLNGNIIFGNTAPAVPSTDLHVDVGTGPTANVSNTSSFNDIGVSTATAGAVAFIGFNFNRTGDPQLQGLVPLSNGTLGRRPTTIAAVDQVPANAGAPTVDQTNAGRPAGVGTDIGAIETAGVGIPAPAPLPGGAPGGG